MGRRPKAEPISHFSRVLLDARGGSLDALGQLFESCRPWLLAVAARELYHDHKTKSAAADFVQDAFLEAQRDFERFQGKHSAYHRLPPGLRVAITFLIVCFSWVFFRAKTLENRTSKANVGCDRIRQG